MSKYIYNHISDPVDDRDFKFDKHCLIIPSVSLPVSVDLRRGGLPQVLDQSTLGSCTANAISNSLRFKGKLAYQPSRLFIYYFSRLIEGTVSEDSGCVIRDVMKEIAMYGACSEHLLPYDIIKYTIKPSDQCQKAALQHIKSFKYMSVNQDMTSLKNALCQGYMITFGISVFDSFESDAVAKTGYVPMPDTQNEQNLGGHCINIVGYSDVSKLFTIMNSWSDSWGDNGFCYLPYKYVLDSNLASDFWICENYI